jgi:hypothetical protein
MPEWALAPVCAAQSDAFTKSAKDAENMRFSIVR